MCLGVYLGEVFLPITLIRGIACRKSTMAQMLMDPHSFTSMSRMMAGGSAAAVAANNEAAAAALDQSLNSSTSMGMGCSCGNTNINNNLEKGKA